MLDGTFPQVLARLLVVQSKDERVFLLLALFVVLDYDQSEFLLLKVQLGDLRPEEQADLLRSLKHQDSRRCQAQVIFVAVLALGMDERWLIKEN